MAPTPLCSVPDYLLIRPTEVFACIRFGVLFSFASAPPETLRTRESIPLCAFWLNICLMSLMENSRAVSPDFWYFSVNLMLVDGGYTC